LTKYCFCAEKYQKSKYLCFCIASCCIGLLELLVWRTNFLESICY